jgi:selenide,water dikinase
MSALRAGIAGEAEIGAAAASMERLNRYAAEALADYPVHASEMAGTEHTLFLDGDSLPLLPGAMQFAKNDLTNAGAQRNRNFMEGKADIRGAPTALQEIAFDPQTSGGLLIALPAEHAEALLTDIQKTDPVAAIVGTVSRRVDYPVVLLA